MTHRQKRIDETHLTVPIPTAIAPTSVPVDVINQTGYFKVSGYFKVTLLYISANELIA